MVRFILISFLIFSPFFVKGQGLCFHKVYSLSDSSLVYNDVTIEDSTFLISGSLGRGIQRVNPVMVRLDRYGVAIFTDKFADNTNLHNTCFSFTQLEKNIFGKYNLHYTTINKNSPLLWRHTRMSWSESIGFENLIFFDSLVNNFFQYFDSGRLLVVNTDSSYYTVGNYLYRSTLDTNNNLPDNSGLFLFKFSQINDSLIWTKRLSYSYVTNDGPTLAQVNLLKKEDGELLLIAVEFQDIGGWLPSFNYAKVKFYTIDQFTGNTIASITLQDTPFSFPGFGAAFINNEKDLLLSYSESTVEYTSTGQPYRAVRPTVARLDSNFNVVWKDTLRTYLSSTLGCSNCIEKYVIDSDSTFAGAFSYISVKNEGLPSQINYYALRITKRKQQNGNVIWNRDYQYYPVINNNNIANYTIHDAEATPDGGYIFVGESTNFDSLNANAPGQLGYVIKTNCLGFLGAPEAGFSHETNDSLGVSFTNTSLMAGSYNWDFGDSTTLQTGEDVGFDYAQPPIFHQYAFAGDYEVSLIGFGCNGENDTIRYTITVPEYTPEPMDTVIPANPNIVNYMALGPNPVKSGESIAVYVGNLPSANAKLSFYNYEGKLVLERPIPQSKSTYIISLPFSAGVYQAVLRDGKEVLEVEKVFLY